MSRPELLLASRSPRRLELLREAGFAPQVVDAGIDDARLQRGAVSPEAWVLALACLKAAAGRARLAPGRGEAAVVLGADTLCAVGVRLLGQPRDETEAAEMLALLQEREHRTITGAAILHGAAPCRRAILDTALVRWGRVDRSSLDDYLASGAWRGKAGAYNLAERIDAGWPVTCVGDPTTVMGLPMRRLAPRLRSLLGDNRADAPCR